MKTIKETTPEVIDLVKASFPNCEVTFTKRGNIKILNPLNCNDSSWINKACKKWYVIGLNYDGYWIRRVKYSTYRKTTDSTYPLHYNRNTYKYTFETFNEALTYFLNGVNKKKINL